MIEFIKGTLIELGQSSADESYFVIESNGMGYRILTAQKASANRALSVGEDIKIYTSLIVREDSMQLVGFLQKDERHCFELLLKASGVGVKSALALMSALSVSTMTSAIMAGDHKPLTAAKGIGPKVAQKITLELRDKMQAWRKTLQELSPEQFTQELQNRPATSNAQQLALDEAETVLLSLGYTPDEIYSSLRLVQQKAPDKTDAAEILQLALKALSSNLSLT